MSLLSSSALSQVLWLFLYLFQVVDIIWNSILACYWHFEYNELKSSQSYSNLGLHSLVNIIIWTGAYTSSTMHVESYREHSKLWSIISISSSQLDLVWPHKPIPFRWRWCMYGYHSFEAIPNGNFTGSISGYFHVHFPVYSCT